MHGHISHKFAPWYSRLLFAAIVEGHLNYACKHLSDFLSGAHAGAHVDVVGCSTRLRRRTAQGHEEVEGHDQVAGVSTSLAPTAGPSALTMRADVPHGL
eukprot:COSAG02_NODE_7568_length_2956_cov_1.381036_3_plen_99_part_00